MFDHYTFACERCLPPINGRMRVSYMSTGLFCISCSPAVAQLVFVLMKLGSISNLQEMRWPDNGWKSTVLTYSGNGIRPGY